MSSANAKTSSACCYASGEGVEQDFFAGQGEEAAVANLRKLAADGVTEAVATLKCLRLAP